MADIPQNDGLDYKFGTSKGTNAGKVDTWIEYWIGPQYQDSHGLHRAFSVWFYGAVKNGYKLGTSGLTGMYTTLTVDGDSGVTVSNGPYKFYEPTDVNEYGSHTTYTVDCPDLSGGTIDVSVKGSATVPSEWVSGGEIDTTIPVSFTPATYTIVYEGNGGSSAEWGTSWSEQVSYGSDYAIRDNWYSNTGHKFVGWTTHADGTDDNYGWTGWSGTWTYTEDSEGCGITDYTLTLYARWEPNNYTLDINGLLDGVPKGNIDGYGTFDVYINGYLMASNVSDYCEEYPYGYTFEVTNIKASTGRTYLGTSAGSLSGTVVGNMTTQLNFKTNTYYFDLNILLPDGSQPWQTGDAGSVEMSINNGEWTRCFNEPQTSEDLSINSYYPYGTTFGFRNFIPGTGLCLSSVSGATQNADGTWSAVLGTSELIVEFHTEKNTYQVTYDANGGSGNMEPSTATYGEEFITRKNTFVRSGYEFIGWVDDHGTPWTLTSSGVYESGKSLVWTYTEGRILYAQWKPKAEMFAKDGDHYRRGLAKVKHDGKWRDGTTIYKKINGHWVAKN